MQRSSSAPEAGAAPQTPARPRSLEPIEPSATKSPSSPLLGSPGKKKKTSPGAMLGATLSPITLAQIGVLERPMMPASTLEGDSDVFTVGDVANAREQGSKLLQMLEAESLAAHVSESTTLEQGGLLVARLEYEAGVSEMWGSPYPEGKRGFGHECELRMLLANQACVTRTPNS